MESVRQIRFVIWLRVVLAIALLSPTFDLLIGSNVQAADATIALGDVEQKLVAPTTGDSSSSPNDQKDGVRGWGACHHCFSALKISESTDMNLNQHVTDFSFRLQFATPIPPLLDLLRPPRS